MQQRPLILYSFYKTFARKSYPYDSIVEILFLSPYFPHLVHGNYSVDAVVNAPDGVPYRGRSLLTLC
jgi:hypothetical protein